jgi:hypothetical protein
MMPVNAFVRPSAIVLISRFVPIIPLIFMIILSTTPSAFSQLRATRQLTDNNVVALAGGNGDTLWLATGRGFNYRTSAGTKDGWPGFETNELEHIWGITFGGGGAAALIYKSAGNSDSTGFWHFNHSSGKQQQKFFRFSRDVRGEEGNLADPSGSAVFARGNFWAPLNHGGMVKYNPSDNSVYAIRPGDVAEILPQNLNSLNSDGNIVNSKRVLSLAVDPANNSILVTTPSTLWSYTPSNKEWEILHENPKLASAEETFDSFDAAFTVTNKNNVSSVYSFMTVKRDGRTQTALYSLTDGSDRWVKAFSNPGFSRFSIYPALDGLMYVLFYDDNEVRLYADTLSAGQAKENHLQEVMKPADFRAMLANAGNDPNPQINDMLFLPHAGNGGTGTLAVATNIGLYICESARPQSGVYGPFTLVRYVRSVGAGEAYALPGIIRGSYEGLYDKCVFVYKLKKDGNVTIKVYDYNMSLVKTVTKGARRRAGTDAERSTDPARDVWDGTNEAGKRAWPGVYYFKITSSSGDRLFGKVVLAK